MNHKLKEYQVELSSLKRQNCERLGIPFEDDMDVVLKESEEVMMMATTKAAKVEVDQELSSMLSLHILGPLIDSFEVTIAHQQRQIRQAQLALKTHLEESKILIIENDQLREQLETTKRELASLVNLNLKHSDVTRPAGKDGDQPASSAEIMELKSRAHLLTEENHVLFEQISALRSHHDRIQTVINQQTQNYEHRLKDMHLKLAAAEEGRH